MGISGDLSELARLRADGFLTAEEFEAAKRQLLQPASPPVPPPTLPELAVVDAVPEPAVVGTAAEPAVVETLTASEPSAGSMYGQTESPPDVAADGRGGIPPSASHDAAGASPPSAPPKRQPSLPYDPAGLLSLGRWARALIFIAAGLFGLAALLAVGALDEYLGYLAGTSSESASVAADDRYAGVLATALLVSLVAAVVLVVWMWRYWAQLHAATGARPRRGRGWTIGGWVTPVAMLWIPKQLMDDFWRLSHGPGDDDDPKSVAPLLHWWWGLFLAGWLSHNVAQAALETDNPAWHLFYGASLAGGIAAGIAGTFLGMSLSDLADRLHRLSTPDSEPFNAAGSHLP